MARKLRTKSALSWAGSDSEVAEQLAALLDDCLHVTIPFCGGLSILPHLKARTVVCNDLHRLAINFYRYASGVCGTGRQQQLIDRCKQTLSHPAELEEAYKILSIEQGMSPKQTGTYMEAWAFWATCWLARKGLGGTKSQEKLQQPSIRRTAEGGNNASRLQTVIEDLELWVEHFKRCEFECLDYKDQLQKVADKPRCGIYVDAPWVGAGSMYLHSFSASKADKGGEHHKQLRDELSRFKHTRVVVRYDDDQLIRLLYKAPHWIVQEAESRDRCNAMKPELWITNGV